MSNTTPRIAIGANQDTTGRTITQDYQTPAYAASYAMVTNSQYTIIKVGTLTGAPTYTINATAPLIGDELKVLLTADGTQRIATFSTGFGGVTTLTVGASSSVFATFMFNGTVWVFGTSGTYTALAADVQAPAYGASIAITTTANRTVVVPAVLTGALTVTAVLTNATKGDILNFLFLADTTARVVTFSTGLTSFGTLTVPISGNAGIAFIYDGAGWVETSRDDARGGLDIQAPAYSATLTMVTTKRETTYQPALLTGALTINATITSAKAGDKVYFSFISDSGGEVVTFGTNFKSSGTLTLNASKWAGASAVFNGTFWVLTGREISA